MSNTERIHGGPDASGAAPYDFSSNSNACGPCPMALAAVQAVDVSRYPDASYSQLRQALAQWHGVERWRIVLAGSASEFIFRITGWLQQNGQSGQGRYWAPVQAYGDYAHAASAWGLQRSSTLEDAHLVWACEPSSPLGQAHTQWPGSLQGGGSGHTGQPTVVLDAAYEPLRLIGAPSLSAQQRDKLWQLHSPNKALALTGLRAAYAIAPLQAQQAAQQLQAMAPSWVVGAHGQAMLLAWTQPGVQAWLQDSLPRLRAWKFLQVQALQNLGWQCLPSDTNFFCAQPPAPTDLARLLPQLRARGIKLRDAHSLGLPGWVRLSAQPPQAQQALYAALTQQENRMYPPNFLETSP